MRRLVGGGSWALAGALCSRGASLAVSYLLARSLGSIRFGQIGIIQSTVALFGTVAGFSLGVTATKYVAQFRDSDPQRAGRIIGLSVVIAGIVSAAMAAALLFLAPGIAEATLRSPELTRPLQISAALLFFTAFNGAQLGALAGFEAFRPSAFSSAASAIATLVCVAVAVRTGTVGAVMGGLSIGAALTCLITHLALVRVSREYGVQPTIKNAAGEWAVLARFAAPAALGALLVAPVNWLSLTFLTRSGGYGEAGVFSAANQWRSAILFLPGTLGNVFLPMLAHFNGKDQKRQFTHAAVLGITVNAVAAILVGVPLILVARPIMAGYGVAFAGGGATLRVIVIASVLTAVSNHLSRVVASIDRMWVSFGFDAAWGLAYLAAGRLLAPGFGALGLAGALAVAAAIQFVCQLAYVLKERWR